MPKADFEGTPVERWAAQVDYISPRVSDRAKVTDSKRCAQCASSAWQEYRRGDGGWGSSLKCGNLSVPTDKGVTVQERASCIKWERKP